MSTEPTSLGLAVNKPQDTVRTGGAICDQAPAASKTDLWLMSSPKLPRKLHLELSAGGWLYARVHAKTHSLLVLTGERLADCYLDVSQANCLFLCLGPHASFMLSASEATQIRATFEPLGLVIREAK
jgi:hypothetical protein